MAPRLRTEEILALARDMYTNGTMNDVTYCKITMRDVPKPMRRRSRLRPA